MNCPSCGAAMRFEDGRSCLTCEYCGNIQVLEADRDGVAMLGEASPVKCPLCKTPMEEAAVHGRQLLCCPRCRGLLVAMSVFVEVTGTLRAERTGPPESPHRFDPKDLERALLCPSCGAPMDTHLYAGPGNVVIATCEFCDLEWLDHGALRHIVAAPGGAYSE